MASSVKKTRRGSSVYWYFVFTSARKAAQGLPRKKFFYFSADRHKKSDVEGIRDEYEGLYRSGSFDPWSEQIPAPDQPADGVMLLSQATRRYLEHIPSELAGKTVKVAGDYLSMMIGSIGDVYLHTLSGEDLTGWVNSLQSHHSRRSAKYHADRFTRWAAGKGLMEQVPGIRIYSTGEERRRKTYNVITEEQLGELIEGYRRCMTNSLANPHTPRSHRDAWANHMDIARVMFYMGLRINDVLHVRPGWILNEYRFLRIGDLYQWGLGDEYHPKSKKEYDPVIVIPPQVTDIFRRLAGRCSDPHDRLFGLRSPKTIQVHMKMACRQAFDPDFCRKFSPHSLRHSCATFWLNERGVPIQEVQRLMRHANINITMGYYHPSTDAHFAAFHGGQLRSVINLNN